MKRILALLVSLTMICSLLVSTTVAFAADPIEATTNTGVLDELIFGNTESEQAHSMTENLTGTGVDNKKEAQYLGNDGLYEGGGIGDGLSYRYIKPSADEKDGILDFTMKADATRQNYVIVRLNGSQDNRGNLMIYGPNGDNSILNARTGRVDSELDPCYFGDYPFGGRYYYMTYSIPQEMISSDGTVKLSIMANGKFDSYGAGVYTPATQSSKYIYSLTLSTDPYYYPTDNFTGEAPKVTVKTDDPDGAYDYLSDEVYDMTKLVMSWQFYGDKWDNSKTYVNGFLDGACPVYSPLETNLKFDGKTSDEWARKFDQQAVLHQNWSTMSVLSVYANAYMFDFAKELHNNEEVLDRYIKLLDFFERAQDSTGGWCYYTKGEDMNKWLGASLDGDGTRLKGERWPLLSLGIDAMIQSFIQLNDYILKGDDEKAKTKYLAYLDEKFDGDLTGKMDKTRREFYIEMFAKLRDYIAYPPKNDFYNPASRAGTANQDFGFAYDANRVINLLTESATGEIDIPAEYRYKDSDPYQKQMLYKFGEMVDGEKWYSTENAVGLEGGASHGGWAGDYGTLLIRITNKYAESAKYGDPEVKEIFDDLSNKAYTSAGYFYYPSVNSSGVPILNSEVFSSPRNYGVGQKISYPVAGYTATELNNSSAKRFLSLYIEQNRGKYDTLRTDIENNTPHVFTVIDDAQEYLKYYKVVQEDVKKNGIKPEEYLPMEDEHPDFAWYDLDSQSVVFKNNGDKCYITFNYRRENWKYNDNTRIHFVEDEKIARYADVQGTHQGDVFKWEDTTVNGETYTHTRFDGMPTVKFGNYIAAINHSTNDPAVGQDGKTYTLDTLGIKKAKDIVSGTVYTGENGGDINVAVAPRTGVVLEILESEPVYQVSAKYIAGDTILGYDNVVAKIGDNIDITAKSFDGYKRIDAESKNVITTTDNAQNTVEFKYEKNAAPSFNESVRETHDTDFKVTNYMGVTGGITTDDNGDISSIYSTGIEEQNILPKTFAYKEATDNFEMGVRLDHFDRTASDQDYFSIVISDNVDLNAGNYIELRHFSNNNNILLVSHTPGQGNSAKGYWAGDMNNKSVPIRFKIMRDGDKFSYLFSLDDGATYEETSKPNVTLDGFGKQVYIGVAMTSSSAILNTAYISDFYINGTKVGAPVNVGEQQTVDFSVTDPEGDALDLSFEGLPYGAEVDENNIMRFTPYASGYYTIIASANDDYHTNPITKTIKIAAGRIPDIFVDGEMLSCDVPPYFKNDLTMVPIRAITEKLGCVVDWNAETNTAIITKDAVTINIVQGSDTMYVNGEPITLDAEAEEFASRTMIPLRAVSENFGRAVTWDDATSTVNIIR